MILTRTAGALLAASLSVLAACGGDDAADRADTTPATTAATTTGAAPVLATTSIWADITSNVACGTPIRALIPAGADPHSYEPSLRDREAVEAARTIIANGLGLEVPVLPLLEASSAEVVEIAPHVDILHHDAPAGPEGEQADEHADGDPHIWQDPRRVAGAVDVIAAALEADGIDTCADAYRDELLALDGEIETLVGGLPPESRLLVTSHDALAYFADRYGFTIVGTVIPSIDTMAEANAADLAALSATVEELQVPAVFTEELSSSADATALAERLGVLVVPLVTDALGTEPGTDTYVEMMRHNAALIVQSLAP